MKREIPAHMLIGGSDIAASLSKASDLANYKEPTEADYLPLPILRYPSWHKKAGQEKTVHQSTVKNYWALLEGDCPKRWYANNISNEIENQLGDAAAMGNRFEFLLTGTLNRDGTVPPQLTTATGAVSKAINARIQECVNLAIVTLEHEGYDIEDAKKSGGVQYYFNHSGIGGTLDLFIWNKKEQRLHIVDLKFSGLIGDKWNSFGWNWKEPSFWNHLSNNRGHKIQAEHYRFGVELQTGIKNVPFIFAVFDNRAKQEGRYRLFRMKSSLKNRLWYLKEMTMAIKGMQEMLDEGKFPSKPDYDRCKGCPYTKEECPAKKLRPDVVEID